MKVNDIDLCIPKQIPTEVSQYEKDVKQLGVGKTGKVGIMELELQRGINNKTKVTKQFSQVPLQVQRALYPDRIIPEMAYIYIVSPSGGILQGDRYRTDITLENRAMAHITTQGATRIYSMDSNIATQIYNISVRKGCYLEYIPDQIIPYRNSRYYQEVNLEVHSDSTLIYSEVLTPGRVAMDESFAYDICFLRTRCIDQENKIKIYENSKIVPKTQKISDLGIMGNYSILGTVYVLTKKKTISELKAMLSEKIESNDRISCGISTISDESGVIIRILGKKTEDIFQTIFNVVEICRNYILGVQFSKIRKN